jgi:hypothetical protein
MLERHPSRVDFVAFWRGGKYVVEIDGPSHYAVWNGDSYLVNEKEYARNLRIERSLKWEGWPVTRIGRWEVEEAMQEGFPKWHQLLSALPFGSENGYPEQWDAENVIPELGTPVFALTDDDIPF